MGKRLTRLNSIVIPCIIISSVNAYRLWLEHEEHMSHEPPLEERTEYPYQNIRTKNFFWGDGDKVRFHHLSDCNTFGAGRRLRQDTEIVDGKKQDLAHIERDQSLLVPVTDILR